MSFPNCKKKNGFTVVNILVVLGIFVALSLISLPYLRRYQPNMKLNGAIRNLAADLRYAQQLTVTEQVVYGVKFNTVSRNYQLIKLGAATSTIKTVYLDSDISYSAVSGLTDNLVLFNFYGGVSESGQVILSNNNSMTAEVDIKPSGYVELVN